MQALRQFSIPFKGLKDGIHEYKFEINESFYKAFEEAPESHGFHLIVMAILAPLAYWAYFALLSLAPDGPQGVLGQMLLLPIVVGGMIVYSLGFIFVWYLVAAMLSFPLATLAITLHPGNLRRAKDKELLDSVRRQLGLAKAESIESKMAATRQALSGLKSRRAELSSRLGRAAERSTAAHRARVEEWRDQVVAHVPDYLQAVCKTLTTIYH